MFEKEKNILKENKEDLLNIDGVVSVGLCKEDEDEPKIKIEILKDYSASKIPEKIQGLEIRVEKKDVPEKPLRQGIISFFQRRHRPIHPGLQIRNYGNGSIGFFINHEGKNYLITAAHLLPEWSEGDQMGQPFFNSTHIVAKLREWINIYGYPRNIGCAGDAMALEVKEDIEATNRLSFPDDLSERHKYLDGLEPLEIIEPELDMEVVRVGRTTGFSTDKIVEIDASVVLQGVGDNPFWRCNNVFKVRTNSSLGGDSGGGIFSIDPPGIVGLCMYSRGGCTATDSLEQMGFGRHPSIDLSKKENPARGSKYFKDVTEDYDWGGGAVEALDWLYEQGLIAGVSEDEFAPDRDITRYEKAQLMKRMVDRLGGK